MRRHDLDWLRVIVFGLLILYHVGMFFVPWGWHIKNNIIYPELRWPMFFVNQWRLPILFVISGMGTYYALSKRSAGQFVSERIFRLLLPLVIGMVLVVPPQVYFERLYLGQFSGTFLEFWPKKAFDGVYPEGNFSWHHLWFLPYLLLYSMIMLPAFLYLRKNQGASLLWRVRKLAATPFGLYWLLLPLYLWEALLEPFFPSTHALVNDWFNFINYLTLFAIGFLLITVGNSFWNTMIANRMKYLVCGLAGFSLLLAIKILLEDSIAVHFTEALIKVFNMWSWMLFLFGFAAYYLNKPSRVLSYANEAVYPFYILHQTITVVIGFYLIECSWGFWPKIMALTAGTFLMSWLIYEFGIRRWRYIRPLFGLKLKSLKRS
jgi:glucans biosynthesis protein C